MSSSAVVDTSSSSRGGPRWHSSSVVIDAWQGRGVGSILMRHLVNIAGNAGLHALTAEVLPENAAMLNVFGKFGFKPASHRDPQTVHLVLNLEQDRG
jgi:ribosomal protein S18 acetylase RimI-like enzyme